MSDHESEAQTRRRRIDPQLRAVGWKIVPFVEGMSTGNLTCHAVEEYQTAKGPADYALFVDGQIIGIVEAKKVSRGAAGILTQAERYAEGIAGSPHNFRGLRVPFLYSTNGEEVYFHDVRDELAISRPIRKFHTPDALRELFSRILGNSAAWFEQNSEFPSKFRPYQIKANRAAEKAICDHKRRLLIAMATGTGKTFTVVNQCYRLLKSGTARRILFLVDRRALAAQAVRAFAEFEPEPNQRFDKIYEVYSGKFQRGDFGDDNAFDAKTMPEDYLLHPEPKHTFVYVCTIQRLAGQVLGRQAAFGGDGDDLDSDIEPLDIPIHAFDVIIADECHRGYTASERAIWRETLDHFDAVKIGLTATPAKHTIGYFTELVFQYTTEEAVRDGFLVDFDLVKVKSDVRINGMFLEEGELVERVDIENGLKSVRRESLEDEREFDSAEIERAVTSPDSNRKILAEIKKYADAHEQRYGRFPKTLIFAANDVEKTSHADELVSIAREVFGRGDDFVEKITGKVDRPLQQIRKFRNLPSPAVVVTVDLLATGVDVPAIEYIVFLRPVKSRILFVQMLGRGTRKCEDIHKSHFTVFDCFDGTLFQYFKDATDESDEANIDQPTRSIGEITEDIWANRDREYNVRCLVKRLQRINKEMAPEAREMFEALDIPEGDIGKFASQLPTLLNHQFADVMGKLRNPQMTLSLENYPRRARTFFRAIENIDSVSSEYLIRDGKGNQHKPEDYLNLFARFVRDNPSQIEAIRILLERPADWSTEALKELRQKLTAAPERFTVEVLQKAHQLRYQKALVDIISMVKHAAVEQNPLWTADERVDAAFAKIGEGQTFTDEQRQWLDRIRQHLIANLSIDREDFDYIPTLEGAGGWGKANRIFGGRLLDLLTQINRAIAS
ncbi:MAG: type I restriction-modification enzyme R subunit C-terminal domain-containing protein [Planctomycetaceae bacterium]